MATRRNLDCSRGVMIEIKEKNNTFLHPIATRAGPAGPPVPRAERLRNTPRQPVTDNHLASDTRAYTTELPGNTTCKRVASHHQQYRVHAGYCLQCNARPRLGPEQDHRLVPMPVNDARRERLPSTYVFQIN